MVLMFHGCGGLGAHLDLYATAATAQGVRVAVVDSFAPRGWSDRFAKTFVCTGAVFRGAERAGDVLASAHGAVAELGADAGALVLAGWSHGAWSIMDLMTMPLEHPGEAGLVDPRPRPLDGVKGLFWPIPTAASQPAAAPTIGCAAPAPLPCWARRTGSPIPATRSGSTIG